jgi:hypothetical protein
MAAKFGDGKPSAAPPAVALMAFSHPIGAVLRTTTPQRPAMNRPGFLKSETGEAVAGRFWGFRWFRGRDAIELKTRISTLLLD